MPKRPPTALYFTTVAVRAKDAAVVGGHLYAEKQEPSVTRIMAVTNGRWESPPDREDVAYGMATKPPPKGKPRRTVGVMGRRGSYVEFAAGEPAASACLDLRGGGTLHDLKYVGRHLHACGTQNMVQRQEGDRWVRVDQGAFKPLRSAVTRIFFAIDGFSEDDIYAVGYGGAIWHFDGKTWTELDSPTDVDLQSVLCSSGGDVFLGGGGGLVFKGDVNGWTRLENEPADEDTVIWDMAEYRGKIYLAAYEKLLLTDGGPVAAVPVPLAGAKTFMALDADEDQLWSVGDDNIFQFDGRKWKRHVCPENG